ncbi:MAG: hypothetical protein IBJ10_11695 [Phycisphaerales bacterium]|nr:hypothetical protein [Phycisphaerales bacterium]
MMAACSTIGCGFPTRREAAVWGALGLFVGLVALLAVLTASSEPARAFAVGDRSPVHISAAPADR